MAYAAQSMFVTNFEPFALRTMPGCDYLPAPTPQYEWVDITSTGTMIDNGNSSNPNGDWDINADDGFFDITMPFDFPFYGFMAGSTLTIGTNGYLTLGTGHFPWGNSYELPHTRTLGGVDITGMVAGLWTDLNPAHAPDGCGVYYQTENTRVIVSYVCVPHWTPSDELEPNQTFQMIVYSDGT
eukprot:SAG22_NODE_8421_length_658_cov_0.744186_1_plen_182_part_01